MHWEGVHQLIQKARLGDRQALDCLYVLAQPYLLRLAQRLLGPNWPHESVSDLTQETWVHALKGIGSFAGAAGDADTGALFRAWLGRTMKNVRLNGLRFNGTLGRQPPPGTVPAEAVGDSTSRAPGVDPPAPDPTRPRAPTRRATSSTTGCGRPWNC
jgi:DNA-directed RNA polymerase specialized sigma24 family protein